MSILPSFIYDLKINPNSPCIGAEAELRRIAREMAEDACMTPLQRAVKEAYKNRAIKTEVKCG